MTVTALTFSPNSAKRLSDYAIQDAVNTVDPDVALLTSLPQDKEDPPSEVLRNSSVDILVPSLGSHSGIYTFGDIQLALFSSFSSLDSISDAESNGSINQDKRTYVITNLLDINANKHALEATLEGGGGYRKHFPRSELQGDYTHISTNLPADYHSTWDNITLYGCSPPESKDEPPAVAALTLPSESDDTLVPDIYWQHTLGLQALNSVGPSRAETLSDAALDTRKAVSEATDESLTDLSGIAEKTGTQILASALSMANGEIVRTSRQSVPASSSQPLFLSIKTDGQSPSLIWLIAVYDSDSDTYKTFHSKDPNSPETAVGEFLTWILERDKNQPLITWNGSFIYRTIKEQLNLHCPNYTGIWDNLSTHSLRDWALEEGNATIPGKKPTLHHVASALDSPHTPNKYTATQAVHSYQLWMETQTAKTEPDWKEYASHTITEALATSHIHSEFINATLTTTGDSGFIQPVSDVSQNGLEKW
jgi:hypothetical protein